MKRYVSLQAGEGCSALKVLPLLARDAVRVLDEEMGIGEEDLLYVLKIDGWGKSVVRELAEARVKAVILPRHVYTRAQEQHLTDEFRDAGLPVLSGADLSPRVKGKIGVADTDTSGAGTSVSGPIFFHIARIYPRLRRSSSPLDISFGLQMIPPFPPPSGRPRTEHFHVIHADSARTVSMVSSG